MLERKKVDFDGLFSNPRSVSKARRVLPDGLEDDFDEEPVEPYGSIDGFQLVGHGEQTNELCGAYLHLAGCLRVDLHNVDTLDGENHKGKIFKYPVHNWCHKPSCPVCYKHGWAIRQAHNITARLAESSKKYGLAEHIVVSVPVSDYGLPFDKMRKKLYKVLVSRNVIGGTPIFHGMRYNLKKGWYWSPHWHVLGHILGGYSRCRNCKDKWNCREGCGGFDDRRYQLFLKDGYYVKVMEKRKTVFGTAWYQLHHATIDTGKKRFHVSTWFGVCSYRKLKVTPEKRKSLCPICKHECVPLWYNGSKDISLLNKYASFEDLVEGGEVVWAERVLTWGSGSYED